MLDLKPSQQLFQLNNDGQLCYATVRDYKYQFFASSQPMIKGGKACVYPKVIPKNILTQESTETDVINVTYANMFQKSIE